MNETTFAPTAAQRSIYLDELMHPDGVLHTMGDCLRLSGPLDPQVLLEAMRALVAEVDALRVRLVQRDGSLVQVVDDAGDLSFDLVDLEHAGADAERLADQSMQADLQRPFDIGAQPLLRGTLFRLGPERHWCYLAMHHVVCDGFSRVPLYGRLAELYRALARAGEDPGAPLPSLRVLVDAERAYLDGPARARDERHWACVASDLPEPLTLSGRPTVPARRHLRSSAVLDAARAQNLRTAASRAGVTWAVFAVAAVSAFVAKAAGRTSCLVTLPVSARTGAQARRVPGMVANYLPVPADTGPWVTRGALLEAMAGRVLRTLRHQGYRGEQVRRLAGLEVGDRRSFGPFVNILPQTPVLDFGEAEAQLVNLSTGIVDDLMVTLLDGPDGTLEVHLNGNPAMYDADDLEAHLAHLLLFLDDFANAGPDQPLGSIPIRTGASEEDGQRPGDGPVTAEPCLGVVEQFLSQVDRRGPATAVRDGDGPVSYTELAEHADAVREQVAGAAVAALLVRPGRWYLGAVLGALAGGAAFAPLDARAPAEHTAGLLADCRADVLLVDATTRSAAQQAIDAMPPGSRLPRCVQVDSLRDGAGTSAGGSTASTLTGTSGSADDPAYVLFTSGTTGRPKGAMVSHSGMVNHLLAKVELLGLSERDTVVQNAPVTFDVSIWQMLAPLLVGGQVRMVVQEEAADPEALARIVAEDGVTVLEVVPSLLGAALEVWTEHDHGRLAALRYLMVTGEAVSPSLCAAWLERHPAVPVVNAYGPTECSDDVTHALVTTPPEAAATVPVGRPVRNTRLKVLGPDLGAMPTGSVGELYVSGQCLGIGYLDDAGKTAAAFVADPSGPLGSRMYRTGDSVRWGTDGQLEFVGRTDHQVKIRGQRVEVGGIEASVRALPRVEDAVVLARTDTQGVHLVAYLRAPESSEGELSTLRERLAEVLPQHMIPTRWALVDAFPLTPHGKVDRTALGRRPSRVIAPGAARTAEATGAGSGPEAGAPAHDALVATLRAAFVDVLRIESVGPDDDFFTLGGDSIGAIQLSGRARSAALPLTPQMVFQHRTPAALAARLARAAPPPAPPAPQAEQGELELSPIALQLADDCPHLDGPVATYAQVARLRAPGRLTYDAALDALTRLTEAHPALRTRFGQLAPGVWRGDVEAEAPDPLGSRLVEIGTGDPAAAIRAASERLDVQAGIAWQALLEPGEPGWLTLVVHHLCIDGVSWRVLCEDLDLLTRAATTGGGAAPALPAEATSFATWSSAQCRLARSADFVADERPVWALPDGAGAEPMFGPLDPTRHTYGSAAGLRVELPSALSAAVLALPPSYRADLNDILLGALAVAVDEWRGDPPAGNSRRSVTVELEGHGREQLRDGDNLDVSRTLGWFTSAFPVALACPPEPAGTDRHEAAVSAVKAVHRRLRRLRRHGMGHGMLRWLHPRGERLLPAQDTPELGFNYLGRFGDPTASRWTFAPLPAPGDAEDPGEVTLTVHGPIGTVTAAGMPLRHVIEVTAATEDRPEGPVLVAHWTWAPDLLAERSVDDLAAGWFAALELLVHGADRVSNLTPTVEDLPLVDLDDDGLRLVRDMHDEQLLDVLPLTPVQRGMLVHSRFDDGPDPYVLQVSTPVRGPLDPARLRAAFSVLLHRHPVLGAEFHLPTHGAPVLVVRRRDGVRVETEDLSRLAGDERDRVVGELARLDRETPFDLTTGPSIRCRVLTLGPDEHRIVLSVHHILVDGWSMPLVVGDLLGAYRDRTSPSGPPALRTAYTDCLRWTSQLDRGRTRAAWADYLAGATRPTLVRDIDPPGPTAAMTASGSRPVECSAGLAERLADLAHRHGATLSTLVLVAWSAVLARLTGRGDVLFGLTVSTRPLEVPGSERAVGLLLNTVPFRARVRPGEGLGSLLRRTQEEQLALAPHLHAGLGEVLALQPALRDHGEPFDSVVVVENFPFESSDGMQVAGLTFGAAEVTDNRHQPLSLVVDPGAGHLTLRVDIAPRAVSKTLADAVVSHLEGVLGELADGRVPVDLATEGERAPDTDRPVEEPVASDRGAREALDAGAPVTPEEAVVADAFAQVLGAASADTHASFFALGGDSISAIRLVGALRAHGLVVSPRDVFEARTPALIARRARHETAPPADLEDEDPLALTLDELAELDAELGFGGASR